MQPPANTMVKTIGTLWPSALAIRGWVNAARITIPTRVFFNSQSASSMPAETSSMKPR